MQAVLTRTGLSAHLPFREDEKEGTKRRNEERERERNAPAPVEFFCDRPFQYEIHALKRWRCHTSQWSSLTNNAIMAVTGNGNNNLA